MNIYKFSKCALIFFAVNVSSNALALSSFSRACNMAELDSYGVLQPALYLFNRIGMPDAYLSIPQQSTVEKGKYWVNESFTLDVTNQPYLYLYTENRVYTAGGATVGGGATNTVKLYKEYKSGYQSSRYSDLTLNDRLTYAITSRHLIFFARAGESGIIDYIPSANHVVVHGVHYAIDPLTTDRINVPATKTINCNALGGVKWPG